MLKAIIIILFLIFIGPLVLLLRGEVYLFGDYRTANRDSSRLAPDPIKTTEAVIQVYTARAFNWHGLFSAHTWISIKKKNAPNYQVYQVVGWRLYRGLAPLVIQSEIPDRNWFDQKPSLLVDLRGDEADAIIPKIEAAAKKYPYAEQYTLWPGPNSNTFTAFILREIPELRVALPSNAVGKDFLGYRIFAQAPSHTGYQLSLYGLLGILVAKEEGFEINVLGMVLGFNPLRLTLKLPGLGEIPFKEYKRQEKAL